MRCRHCGADYFGGRCQYCGSDEFVDVEGHYNPENMAAYTTGSTYLRGASSRKVRARIL
jgi:hypothetical protein